MRDSAGCSDWVEFDAGAAAQTKKQQPASTAPARRGTVGQQVLPPGHRDQSRADAAASHRPQLRRSAARYGLHAQIHDHEHLRRADAGDRDPQELHLPRLRAAHRTLQPTRPPISWSRCTPASSSASTPRPSTPSVRSTSPRRSSASRRRAAPTSASIRAALLSARWRSARGPRSR